MRRSGASPIVLEDFGLIFFSVQKIGGTVWKQLFRRMIGKEDWRTGKTWGHHTGLVYLADLNIKKATALMNSPRYVRAVFARDPKQKFLSAFLDKAIRSEYFYRKCLKACRRNAKAEECLNMSRSFEFFVKTTRKSCKDTHWSPQSINIERKYLHTLNFVGHLDTAKEDAEFLLKHIGVWEKFGKSGWGKFGNESIFESLSYVKHKTSSLHEASSERLKKYYTPKIEKEIDARFAEDYKRKIYNLRKIELY